MAKKNDKNNKKIKPTEAIAKRASQMLAKSEKTYTVKMLEEALLKEFPAEDALSWDRTGLFVGEGALPVKKIAIALDPTVSAIEEAAKIGAQVLVTHHPLFLEAPDKFYPEKSVAQANGAGVWAAIKNQVAVMSFHTALDVSKQAQIVMPSLLGFQYKGQLLEYIENSRTKGFGQICKVPKDNNQKQTLRSLAAKCITVFGRPPRVWGNPDAQINVAVCANGSASGLTSKLTIIECDCLICGEIKYHDALELSQAGLNIIEVGHDLSELPLIAVLANTIANLGFSKSDITVIDQSENWFYPESIRL